MKKLDTEIINNKDSKFISTEEALEDIIPFLSEQKLIEVRLKVVKELLEKLNAERYLLEEVGIYIDPKTIYGE